MKRGVEVALSPMMQQYLAIKGGKSRLVFYSGL